MSRILAPVAALLMIVGCAGPRVVPATQNEHFKLPMLRDQTIAVWPIATAELDESTGSTVVTEYSNQNRFLDAFSLKLSNRLIGLAKANSIGSDKVVACLGKDEAGRNLLNPSTILGTQDPNNRFAIAVPNMIHLSDHSLVFGVRYLIIPRDIAIGRQWSQGTVGGGGFVSNGRGGGSFIGGGGNSAKTKARLRLAIIDLDAKIVVWDGAVYADASSSFMKATALHEVEDDLVGNVLKEILGH